MKTVKAALSAIILTGFIGCGIASDNEKSSNLDQKITPNLESSRQEKLLEKPTNIEKEPRKYRKDSQGGDESAYE